MSRAELAAVWVIDAPEGMAWICPDCDSCASLGGYAGRHAEKTGHGVPVLACAPRMNKALGLLVGEFIIKDYGPENPSTWTRPVRIRAIVDEHLIVEHERADGHDSYLQIITPAEWKYTYEYFRVVPDGRECAREAAVERSRA